MEGTLKEEVEQGICPEHTLRTHLQQTISSVEEETRSLLQHTISKVWQEEQVLEANHRAAVKELQLGVLRARSILGTWEAVFQKKLGEVYQESKVALESHLTQLQTLEAQFYKGVFAIKVAHARMENEEVFHHDKNLQISRLVQQLVAVVNYINQVPNILAPSIRFFTKESFFTDILSQGEPEVLGDVTTGNVLPSHLSLVQVVDGSPDKFVYRVIIPQEKDVELVKGGMEFKLYLQDLEMPVTLGCEVISSHCLDVKFVCIKQESHELSAKFCGRHISGSPAKYKPLSSRDLICKEESMSCSMNSPADENSFPSEVQHAKVKEEGSAGKVCDNPDLSLDQDDPGSYITKRATLTKLAEWLLELCGATAAQVHHTSEGDIDSYSNPREEAGGEDRIGTEGGSLDEEGKQICCPKTNRKAYFGHVRIRRPWLETSTDSTNLSDSALDTTTSVHELAVEKPELDVTSQLCKDSVRESGHTEEGRTHPSTQEPESSGPLHHCDMMLCCRNSSLRHPYITGVCKKFEENELPVPSEGLDVLIEEVVKPCVPETCDVVPGLYHVSVQKKQPEEQMELEYYKEYLDDDDYKFEDTANTRQSVWNKKKALCVFEVNMPIPDSLCHPVGVAQLASGEIVVADTFNDRMVLFSRRGRLLKVFNTSDGLRRPAAVVQLPDTTIAVKAHNNIALFDKYCRFLHYLVRGCLLRPYGLTMDEDGLLMTVETPTQNYINILGVDPITGNIEKHFKIKLNLPPELVSQSKPRFITHYGTHNLLVVDLGLDQIYDVNYQTGDVETFGTNVQLHDPSGITCDDQGFIYVANSRNHIIQVFDAAKEYVCVLNCDHRLNRPSGIALTQDNHLLVLNYWSNTVAKYQLTKY